MVRFEVETEKPVEKGVIHFKLCKFSTTGDVILVGTDKDNSWNLLTIDSQTGKFVRHSDADQLSGLKYDEDGRILEEEI